MLKAQQRTSYITGLSLVSIMLTSIALAGSVQAAVLHNWSATSLNGGTGGVVTPGYHPVGGKLCINSKWRVYNMTMGGTWPDLKGTIDLYKDGLVNNTKIGTINTVAPKSTTFGALSKATCWTNLDNSAYYDFTINKAVYDTGALAGAGSITTS